MFPAPIVRLVIGPRRPTGLEHVQCAVNLVVQDRLGCAIGFRKHSKLIIRSYPIVKSAQNSQGQLLAVSRRGVCCRTASHLPVETRVLSAGHSEPLPLLDLESSVGPSGVDSDDFRFCLALTLQATFRSADQIFPSLPFHCGTQLTFYTPLAVRPLQRA
jgi:hypothetical protein